MKEEIWYPSHDLNKLSAKDILNNVLTADKRRYIRAESELVEAIKLLDEAIILYIQSLQAAYHLKDKWKNNKSNRAAIAMMVSTLNYILLARHGILMGYYPEVCDLLRSCYERISRCYLFSHSEKFANRFLSGEKIKQLLVDNELSKLESEPPKSQNMYNDLREYYTWLSERAHPNLDSFEARYGEKNLGEKVGLECLVGGIMSAKRGHVTVIRILQTVLSALRILGVMLPEESGNWDKKYQQIRNKCDEMVDNL